ncbi:MAG: hypothetical protein GY795_04795 [Desulfobacterales bacterium]|nr:hypothetical protein [Desulfobacterales bacterium]
MAVLAGETKLIQSTTDLSRLARWAVKLGKYGIALKTFDTGYREKIQTVGRMVTASVPLEIVVSFCLDFGLDFTEAVGEVLAAEVELKDRHILYLGKKLDRLIRMRGISVEKIAEKLRQILLNDVDPYDYEMIGFFLKKLKDIESAAEFPGGGMAVSKLVTLGNFLASYERKSEPGKEEKTWLMEVNGRRMVKKLMEVSTRWKYA